ncbi:FAD dependent oxidoreductase [Sphaerotilus natans subsp. natans DSM 6575]|uniref:FAD dependent oxidoreductase n=1 Tax=Sphaerotilus natans subsp. natans DSM 6575 TaxID=1286631 RepID=A0A059KHT8_9BURK|nr:NAD(P)/FAD-dependent oxidoreductase [Sphaerotilus natans]KDB51001.1 FAD dependent oxidoreductase [Sphaerotilus natans subsp. natans DSM 6575]SIQ52810.1 L-2-hydroxyglutarate oxidase LhgO [Sphaerotilus natans]
MDKIDTLVVGAGVVGLAAARALAQAGREVVIAEAREAFGTVTSARSSEVIHAGLYYPTGSLKARLCVRGRDLLYAYCAERGIAHRRCGKLIVATAEAQLERLDALLAQAWANGVDDLQRLSAEQARAMEPALACVAALWSPSTGIVDSHGLMLALLADAEAAGAVLALKSPVQALEALDAGRDGYRVTIDGETLQVRRLVNAAGLAAPDLAARLQGRPPGAPRPPEAHFCKGSYFTFAGRAPFSRLIYPVPEAAGLGVHVTLDLGGQMRFGPDVEWLDIASEAQIDYRVDARRQAGMAEAIRRYWPGLPEGALQPGHAGVRPKIAGPQAPSADFRIDTAAVHGLHGLVELLGIESPGLTASLAIGEQVAAALGDALH